MKLRTLVGLIALTSASVAQAGFIVPGDDWTIFGDDSDHIGPGVGGQAFNAEFLFYKLDGNQLTVGLQTGFDIVTGSQLYKNDMYYAGDIALSFNGSDGSPSSYEYGIDFGFYTEGWYDGAVDTGDTGSSNGTDVAGLYRVATDSDDVVTGWSNDVYRGHHVSDPFAIDDGVFDRAITSTSDKVDDSYYRTATFNLDGLGLSDPFELDAHWTMSCGNDAIDGYASVSELLDDDLPGGDDDDVVVSVPEPESIALLGLGLLGLGFARRRSVKA